MRAARLGILVAALASCASAPGGRIDAADVPVPPFPECVADEYAYVGESTMAALGVSRPSGRAPPDADRVGMIWVTADQRPNEGEPGGPVVARMLCIEFPDDGGEIGAMTNFRSSTRGGLPACWTATNPRRLWPGSSCPLDSASCC